jgi:hypothetical protein
MKTDAAVRQAVLDELDWDPRVKSSRIGVSAEWDPLLSLRFHAGPSPSIHVPATTRMSGLALSNAEAIQAAYANANGAVMSVSAKEVV